MTRSQRASSALLARNSNDQMGAGALPQDDKQKVILFIGPVPPPITGQSLACEVFLEALQEKYQPIVIDINKSDFASGGLAWRRVKEIICVLRRVAARSEAGGRGLLHNHGILAGQRQGFAHLSGVLALVAEDRDPSSWRRRNDPANAWADRISALDQRLFPETDGRNHRAR